MIGRLSLDGVKLSQPEGLGGPSVVSCSGKLAKRFSGKGGRGGAARDLARLPPQHVKTHRTFTPRRTNAPRRFLDGNWHFHGVTIGADRDP
jgi:hypothetical protein